MDVLAVTDFPDIRVKCAIQSANQGNILIIPREGGYLVRFYIELDEVNDREMLENRNVTPEKLAKVANRILHPYTIEVKDVGWWSVYEIGQRLCDRFDDVPTSKAATRLPRVFIAGDACHTHSAKAGQGMNVSMADAWNLGWKLARSSGGPRGLSCCGPTRRNVGRSRSSSSILIANSQGCSAPARPAPAGAEKALTPREFQRYFVAQGRFTAGVATQYAPSLITAPATFQHLAEGFPVGMRFHSARVVRLADAKPVHLGHVARADGAWRVYIFADQSHPTSADSLARRLCEFLGVGPSPTKRFTPAVADPDSIIDVRVVFQQGHRELDVDEMPRVLLPRKGRFGLIDYEKMFCPDPEAEDIFQLRRVNRTRDAWSSSAPTNTSRCPPAA